MYEGLEKIVLEYVQEPDCSKVENDIPNELVIETVNNGVANYFVISTDRWAFSDIEDLLSVIKPIIELEKQTINGVNAV